MCGPLPKNILLGGHILDQCSLLADWPREWQPTTEHKNYKESARPKSYLEYFIEPEKDHKTTRPLYLFSRF
jgi:hypothetical protein